LKTASSANDLASRVSEGEAACGRLIRRTKPRRGQATRQNAFPFQNRVRLAPTVVCGRLRCVRFVRI
jgi:hypothetical protein